MTETDIQWIIADNYGSQNVVIPNVTLQGKADPRNDIMGQLMKEAPDSGVMVVSAPEMFNLMRVGCMKWWTRGHTYELRK